MPQEVANRIAVTQDMKYPKMKEMFMSKESKVNKMEAELRKAVAILAGARVERALIAYLPFLLENLAITNYINEFQKYSFRLMMPELLTAEEAGLMAQRDYMMDQMETLSLILLLKQQQLALYKTSKNWQDEIYP